ncbi:unnamed protein product [Closterium sp. Yama58-4]|nr:unnamed protein product [Closterium sp. Yama58-4]
MALSASAATAALSTLNDQGLPGRPFICTGSTPFNTFCARTQGIPSPCPCSLPSPLTDCALYGPLCRCCHGCPHHSQRPGSARMSLHLHGVNALQHLLCPHPRISRSVFPLPTPLFPLSTPFLQIALSMALSAGAATAALTTLNDQGLPGRPFICTGSTPFNTFCARTKAAAAMALISAAFFLPSLLLSGARLASEYYEEED